MHVGWRMKDGLAHCLWIGASPKGAFVHYGNQRKSPTRDQCTLCCLRTAKYELGSHMAGQRDTIQTLEKHV